MCGRLQWKQFVRISWTQVQVGIGKSICFFYIVASTYIREHYANPIYEPLSFQVFKPIQSVAQSGHRGDQTGQCSSVARQSALSSVFYSECVLPIGFVKFSAYKRQDFTWKRVRPCRKQNVLGFVTNNTTFKVKSCFFFIILLKFRYFQNPKRHFGAKSKIIEESFLLSLCQTCLHIIIFCYGSNNFFINMDK